MRAGWSVGSGTALQVLSPAFFPVFRGELAPGCAARNLFFFSQATSPKQFLFPFSSSLYSAARRSDKKGIKSDSCGTKRPGSVTKMGCWWQQWDKAALCSPLAPPNRGSWFLLPSCANAGWLSDSTDLVEVLPKSFGAGAKGFAAAIGPRPDGSSVRISLVDWSPPPPADREVKVRFYTWGYPLPLWGACSRHFRTGSTGFYRLELSFRANEKRCLRKIALNNAFDHIDFIQLEAEL